MQCNRKRKRAGSTRSSLPTDQRRRNITMPGITALWEGTRGRGHLTDSSFSSKARWMNLARRPVSSAPAQIYSQILKPSTLREGCRVQNGNSPAPRGRARDNGSWSRWEQSVWTCSGWWTKGGEASLMAPLWPGHVKQLLLSTSLCPFCVLIKQCEFSSSLGAEAELNCKKLGGKGPAGERGSHREADAGLLVLLQADTAFIRSYLLHICWKPKDNHYSNVKKSTPSIMPNPIYTASSHRLEINLVADAAAWLDMQIAWWSPSSTHLLFEIGSEHVFTLSQS